MKKNQHRALFHPYDLSTFIKAVILTLSSLSGYLIEIFNWIKVSQQLKNPKHTFAATHPNLPPSPLPSSPSPPTSTWSIMVHLTLLGIYSKFITFNTQVMLSSDMHVFTSYSWWCDNRKVCIHWRKKGVIYYCIVCFFWFPNCTTNCWLLHSLCSSPYSNVSVYNYCAWTTKQTVWLPPGSGTLIYWLILSEYFNILIRLWQ